MRYFEIGENEGWKKPDDGCDNPVFADAWQEDGAFRGEIDAGGEAGKMKFTDQASFATTLRSYHERPLLLFGSHRWPRLPEPDDRASGQTRGTRLLFDPQFLFEMKRRFPLSRRQLCLDCIQNERVFYGTSFVREVWMQIETKGAVVWKTLSGKDSKFVSPLFWTPAEDVRGCSPPAWLDAPLNVDFSTIPSL